MARAIAKCTCSICGAQFEKIAFKNNRKEADSFIAWAEENVTTCPNCYKAQQQKETAQQAAQIKEELNLPEISAVSQKQLAFAESLRDLYLVDHLKAMRLMIKILIRFEKNFEKIEAQAKVKGKTPEELIDQAIKEAGFAKEYLLLRCGNAREIIDALK